MTSLEIEKLLNLLLKYKLNKTLLLNDKDVIFQILSRKFTLWNIPLKAPYYFY